MSHKGTEKFEESKKEAEEEREAYIREVDTALINEIVNANFH